MATHKIVRVRIHRGSVGQNQMVYPARYNAFEVDREGIGPSNVMLGGGGYSGHIGLGASEEWCLIVLPSALADEYALDPDMDIVTPAQADVLLETWRVLKGEPDEVVRDPDRLTTIAVKQQAGLRLSAYDLKALDPDDETPGINRRLVPIKRRLVRAGVTLD